MSGNNLDSMSREKKKNQLRRQMVSTQNRAPVLRPESGRDYMSEDSEEIVEKAIKKVIRRRLTVIGLVTALVGAAAFGFYQYQRQHQYFAYKVSWEIPLSEGSYVGYEYFGSNLLKYTKDGASYSDHQGKIIWTHSYEMKAPIVSVKGGYAAIADQRGNKICIYDSSGHVGTASTVRPISKVAVAGNGVVAVVLEEATASYINFFVRNGNQLDLTIKTVMGRDGYPLDISFSNDGTQLVGSYIYLYGGELKNRVVFYDFSEVGKNVPNRLVAGFDEDFDGTVASRVRYLAEPYSCAFTGDSLVFFSSKNLASPELIKKVEIEEEIQSIFYSEEYAGVIVRTGNGEYPSRMDIYSKSGDLVMSREFDYSYVNADIDGDLILLYNEESCQVYNLSGVLKLEAEFDFPVTKIRKGRFPNTLIITGPQNMKEIKMQ